MIFPAEYVQHLGKQTVRQLIKQGVIVVRQEDENKVIERVSAALLDEMQVEDRINEEVRTILEAIRDEMHRTGRAVSRDVQEDEGQARAQVQGGPLAHANLPRQAEQNRPQPSPTPWRKLTKSNFAKTATPCGRLRAPSWNICSATKPSSTRQRA